MSNSEASHAGNLKNFDQLISVIKGYGDTYNPANPLFKIPALEAKSATAHNSITMMNSAFSLYRIAIERRTVIYDPLLKLVNRIFNFLKSSETTDVMDQEILAIIRKLRGDRAGKKLPAPATGTVTEGPVQISVSQLSYNDRLSNFDKLISQLGLIPEYAPNETDLTIAALKDLYTAMDNANKAVLKAENDLSNGRMARNVEFYASTTGITEIGKADKLYIKAVFGASSPQYNQVAGIGFVTYKN